MSKTRKILATLTMVAVTTTASLTAVSSAQAHFTGIVHAHFMLPPGMFGPGGLTPTPPGPPPPPAPPAKKKGGLKPGEAAALGVLGGVLIGGMIANANKNQPAPAAVGLPKEHYAWCGKYKTYDVGTNSFMGNDGFRHPCNSPWSY